MEGKDFKWGGAGTTAPLLATALLVFQKELGHFRESKGKKIPDIFNFRKVDYQHCRTVWRLFFKKTETVAAVSSKPFSLCRPKM